MASFINALSKEDWDSVYRCKDVNTAYSCFLEIFSLLYNKNCPIQLIRNKFAKCPWLTEGLQKACIKKNKLYKCFIKQRTKESELEYKVYKNKLTQIIPSSKKDYYNNLLNNNKCNTKKIWELLNNLTKEGTKENTYPNYFVDEEGRNYNLSDSTNKCNNFLVNVGPDLTAKIPICREKINESTLVTHDSNTLFLSPVNEKELIIIVNRFRSKNSTDCHNIDMTIVKKSHKLHFQTVNIHM